MKKLIFYSIVFIAFFWASIGIAADLHIIWDAADRATGYKVYFSEDSGASWSLKEDVGPNTEYLFQGVPETGMVLFRVSAYNQYGETICFWSGAWYNGLWRPVDAPGGAGIR